MDSSKADKVLVLSNVGDERRTEGFVYIRRFSAPEKMTQALKKLGLFWLMALISVLVPVFHFVLVPLFVFLGAFFAIRTYKSEGRVISGETHCPHCRSEVHIKPTELQWPLTEICQNCARVVRMEIKT